MSKLWRFVPPVLRHSKPCPCAASTQHTVTYRLRGSEVEKSDSNFRVSGSTSRRAPLLAETRGRRLKSLSLSALEVEK